jgi:hypothetical protein
MPKNILVLANETIGGEKLLEAVRHRHAEEPDAQFHVVVPLTRPRHGNVIYDDARRDGAQVRVDLALAFMAEEGIEGTGEVGDEDPFNAAMDAIPEHDIDEIILSTLPVTSSGWLRRDLLERLQDASGLPVEHIVVDLAAEGLPFDVTLVLANHTVAGSALVDHLKQLADEGPRRFIVVVPQDSGDGLAVAAARQRLGRLLDSLRDEGIVAAGMIGDPDPYTAAMNAVHFFHISEIVISTLPADRSQWLADKLIDRVEKSSSKPVSHIEMSDEEAPAPESSAA